MTIALHLSLHALANRIAALESVRAADLAELERFRAANIELTTENRILRDQAAGKVTP